MTDLQKELTLTREFTAPVDMVFKAWTDQELVRQWWGPNGVTNPVCEINWHYAYCYVGRRRVRAIERTRMANDRNNK